MCVSVGACVYEAGAVEVRGVRTTGAGDACEPPGVGVRPKSVRTVYALKH